MPWGAVAGAAIGVVGNAMTQKSNGGAGTTTTDKSPWIAAQPFITSNINSGQNLEDQYLSSPLSTQQQQAIANIYGQNDYMGTLVPSLLSQMSAQPVGYNPSAPATQKAWDWSGLLGSDPDANTMGRGSMTAANAAPAPAPAAAPAAAAPKFVNQGNYDPASVALLQNGQVPTGSYGSFTYGDAMPAPGTQAYKDMSDYFAYGGNDPLNKYGHGNPLVGNTDASTKNINSGGAY